LIKILIITAFILYTFPSYAAEDAEWSEDKIKLEKLTSEGKCDEYWDVLWPWAKQGNLEARRLLFIISAVQLHMPEVYPPGRSGDLISHVRDIIILGLHSLPNQNSGTITDQDKIFIETLTEFITYYASAFQLNSASKAEKFMECWSKEKTQKCTKLAVDNGFIPSWESYSAEIDALIDKGMKSTCIPHTSPSKAKD
jgi:hypothetical protein